MFPAPEFAFRMFLAQFGHEAGRAQLATILDNMKLADKEIEILLPILEMATEHFRDKVKVPA